MNERKINRSRRRFLKYSAGTAGAALVLGVYFTAGGEREKNHVEIWKDGSGGFTPSAWLRIDENGMVTVMVNHTELGQGITTALPMIVADELDADWTRVRAEVAPAEAVYKNPEFGTQMTASSTSVRTSWDILRRAGAAAREMLVTAAAEIWDVPPEECRTESGRVIHTPSGRLLSYGRLSAKASKLPVPDKPFLKTPERYTLIGRSTPRLDASIKIDGSAVFGLDIRRPGMLTATVVHSPVFGGKVLSMDAREALAIPGVRRVFEIEGAVAVVAEGYPSAQNGADALTVQWSKPDGADLDSEAMMSRWAELSHRKGKVVYDKGKVDQFPGGSERVIEAVYRVPFQAHATPEPMNCTADVRPDRCEIWAPTQHQDAAQETAARITGLGYDKVRVHTTFTGGGFGRRIAVDYVAQAVRISKTMNAPVKVVWSREEDMRHDFYRPANLHRLRAALDKEGRIKAWNHRIVGPDHMTRQLPELIPAILPYSIPRTVRNGVASLARALLPRVIAGKKIAEGAAPLPYDIDNVRVEHINDDPGVPVGFWRSVAHSHNAFVVECFLDEIAAAAGKDPFKFRHELLNGNLRLRRVLELAKEKSGYGSDRRTGRSWGICAHDFHGAMLACAAEVTVEENRGPDVNHVVCAVDCGRVINPRLVEDQIIGGIIFGLTAALKSAITIRKGRVVEGNFDRFPIIRMDEAPEIDVHIVKSDLPPRGVGESAVPIIAPAVVNALYGSVGRRIREIPVKL